MATAVGQMLLNRGLISEHQLEEALQAQRVFGGRLGTNLVELGHVRDSDLAETLSAQLRTPCASGEEFDQPSADALATMTGEFAVRYGIFPLRVERQRLRLAMINPADLRCLDDLAFHLGLTVVPVVAPERLVLAAIEKHYRVSMPGRAIALPPADDEGVVEFNCAYVPAGASHPASEPGLPHEIIRKLVSVTKPGEPLDLLRDLLASEFSSGAEFVVQGEQLRGRVRFDHGVGEEAFRGRSVPADGCFILRQVAHGEMFLGPIPPAAPEAQLLREIGINPDRDVMAGPVMADGRLVALAVAGEPRAASLAVGLKRYLHIFQRVGWALELTLRRMRILEAPA